MGLNPEYFRSMVKQVAWSVSSKFPPYIDAADTEQELYLWLYTKRSWVVEQMQEDPRQAENRISALMRKVAFDHCNSEKAASEGFDPADVYRYTVPKIKTLLADVFDYEDWQSFGMKGDGQPSAKGLANQTGDRIAELVDIKVALERLSDDHYNVILWHYKYHYTFENVAAEMEISDDAAKKRHVRALSSLQKILGYKEPEDKPSPGDRRVVRSNAASMAALSNNYEG